MFIVILKRASSFSYLLDYGMSVDNIVNDRQYLNYYLILILAHTVIMPFAATFLWNYLRKYGRKYRK